MPKEKEKVTQEEVDGAVNIDQFLGAQPDPAKNWHKGQFEPWTMDFGYEDGFPLYGGALVNGNNVHIYYLPKKDKTILLARNETPKTYNVTP